jgi:adenylylsulfate kinase-like enzyme
MVSPYRNQRERFKKVENVKEIYLTSDRIRDGKMVECYEPPLTCYREINTDVNSVDKCVNEVLEYMEEKDNQ